MRNTPKILFTMAVAGLGFVLPAAAQLRGTGVLLKVAVPTNIAGHTLQPGSYEVNSWSQPSVITIQKTGQRESSMFVLPTAVSDGNQFGDTAPIEARTSASGVPTITSIYFPAQDRAYYFSPKLEERSDVTHGQQASASTTAR
jgi:hypothetical protein